MENDLVLLLFDSIHQVMQAEQLLERRGLAIDLVPVPKEISSDCGLGITLPAAQLAAARAALEAAAATLRPRLYRRLGRGRYQPLADRETG
ncbi:MAG: DUF3343 domain-containing protein [Deltaproteobacteria bacterium]|nr:DUF3343 domain-containing protein [Deltaproteobacteria bacterium]